MALSGPLDPKNRRSGSGSVHAAGPLDWQAWQKRRLESVGGTNGWTTLIGLHWLNEGSHSAGSSATNDVVLQSTRVPASIGVFTRHGSSVSFTAAPDADVRVKGSKIQNLELKADTSEQPTRLDIGSVSLVVIQRGERMGLRARDPNSDVRQRFNGLRWFPYNPTWRLEGRYQAFPQPRTLRVADVTGGTQEFVSPGEVIFFVQGKEYRLEVADEPGENDFFLLFHDQTAGVSTYDSGRFLYVPKPNSDGHVVVDFNRAYTPPCGFTDYATCPLPPRQNWLSLAVTAGEIKPVGSHH